MKYLLLLILLSLSSCKVLTTEEAQTLRKTVVLNKEAWGKTEYKNKDILIKLNENAEKLLKDALGEK